MLFYVYYFLCKRQLQRHIRSDDYADMSTSDAIKSLLMFSLLLTIDMNSMGSLMQYQNVVFVPKKDIVLETLFQSYFYIVMFRLICIY